ncbi:MAG: zinc-dependent metalloprotease [Lawsonella clevelandensis]
MWTHVPWLAPRLLGAIQDHANGIVVDYSNIESATHEMGLDPEALSDPEKLQEAMSQMQTIELTPEIHYTHEKALQRLETMLALIEGWVDVVVQNAIGGPHPLHSRLGRDVAAAARHRQPSRGRTQSPCRAGIAATPGA